MKKTTLLILVIVIVAAAVAPYANAPKGYFIWDDINLIMMDYQIKSFNYLKTIFTRDFFGFSDNARKYGYYRPLVTISYMIDWRRYGTDPAGYHWTNIIVHIANSLIVFFILARIFRRKLLAPFIATLLFAATPIHTESVTWIAGRTDPMCALFFFLSFYYYMVYSERLAVKEGFFPAPENDPRMADRGRAWILVWSLLFYVFSLLSKEMAISLPLILIGYNLLFVSEFKWRRIKRYFSSFFLFFAASGLYVLVRMLKVGVSEQAQDPFAMVTTLLSFVKTILIYTWKMFFPVYLTAYMQNELVEDVFTWEFIGPFLFLVALIWWMVVSIRKNRILAFSILFLLLSYLPLSNIIRISGPKDMGFMSAERFLYIPSLAVSVFLAMGFARLIGKIGGLTADRESAPNPKVRIAAILLLVVVLGTFTGLTLKRNQVWMDNETFFKASLETAPNAPILYMLLGNVYSIEQNWEKAEETLKMAIDYISPRDREEPTWIYSDLAGVYAKQGLYDKALETMKLASKSKFHNSAVEYNYGEIYRAMGDLERAIHYYQSSLMIYRDNLQALVKLGMCYQQTAKWELSNKAFLSALNLIPNDPDVLNNIGFNYSKLGESRKAQLFFEEALARDPNFARARANLGMELIKSQKDVQEGFEQLKAALKLDPKMVEPRLAMGTLIFKDHPEQALALFKDAYKIQPNNVKTLLYIGLFYRDMKKPDDARSWFEKALKIDPENRETQALLESLKSGAQ